MSASIRSWVLKSRTISEVVRARDQWEAWDTLRERSAFDFGLIVTAETGENADPIAVHTETLMRRWHREAEADDFHTLAVSLGLVTA